MNNLTRELEELTQKVRQLRINTIYNSIKTYDTLYNDFILIDVGFAIVRDMFKYGKDMAVPNLIIFMYKGIEYIYNATKFDEDGDVETWGYEVRHSDNKKVSDDLMEIFDCFTQDCTIYFDLI